MALVSVLLLYYLKHFKYFMFKQTNAHQPSMQCLFWKQTKKPTLSSPLPNSTAEQNIPLATVLAVPAVSLPSIMATLSLLAVGGKRVKQRRPWCCASTAQHRLKHQCITNTALVTNPQHSTICAAMKLLIFFLSFRLIQHITNNLLLYWVGMQNLQRRSQFYTNSGRIFSYYI